MSNHYLEDPNLQALLAVSEFAENLKKRVRELESELEDAQHLVFKVSSENFQLKKKIKKLKTENEFKEVEINDDTESEEENENEVAESLINLFCEEEEEDI